VQALILLSELEFTEEIAAIPELKSILGKMLAKNADARYPNTIDLIKDLNNIQRQLSKNSHDDIYYSFAPLKAAEDGQKQKNVEIKPQTDEFSAKTLILYRNLLFLAGAFILLIVIIVLVRLFF
jgi:hypothetical protein